MLVRPGIEKRIVFSPIIEIFDCPSLPPACAAFKGDLAVATVLLDGGALPDTAGPSGKTALLFAAMFNREDIARLLLERGADPELRDADGLSPLAAAMRMGAADTAALLSKAPSRSPSSLLS